MQGCFDRFRVQGSGNSGLSSTFRPEPVIENPNAGRWPQPKQWSCSGLEALLAGSGAGCPAPETLLLIKEEKMEQGIIERIDHVTGQLDALRGHL